MSESAVSDLRRVRVLSGVRLPAGLYAPLLVLLGVAVALRLYEMVVYSTVVTDYYTGDAGRFIRVGYKGLFYDEWQPAGYPMMLGALRAVTNWLPLTVAVQHLLGIATGLLLFAAARVAGASRALALIPAAFVLLSGDHLFLEQTLLTETLWTTLLAAGLYAALRGHAARDTRWYIAASVLLGLSAITRNVSLVLPVVLALWLLISVGGGLRARLTGAAAGLLPAVAVIVVYMVVASALGPYTGLGEMSGWSLYERVGQFADCSRFTPPPGTRGLCETRPVGERPGPFFYYFDLRSPARKVFPGMLPSASGTAGAFARAAILHQPVDYARSVTKDVVRYFDPHAGFDRELSGSGPDAMSFRASAPQYDDVKLFDANVRKRYTSLDSTPDGGSSLLETWQAVFRLNGLVLLGLVLLTALGIIRGGPFRMACVLCGAFGAALLVVPPAVSSYDARYAIPPAALLAVSAALGLMRIGPRRPERAPSGPAPAR